MSLDDLQSDHLNHQNLAVSAEEIGSTVMFLYKLEADDVHRLLTGINALLAYYSDQDAMPVQQNAEDEVSEVPDCFEEENLELPSVVLAEASSDLNSKSRLSVAMGHMGGYFQTQPSRVDAEDYVPSQPVNVEEEKFSLEDIVDKDPSPSNGKIEHVEL
eukprot:gnl/TRDRNA2_/TRDRNA2_137597_c2_seq1.p1 gnl/TRDRNA2_/TRDRNA2_137597_c2~~gnl/TRDRNA2_/TRDRNA2_137597_c2_seq1.p1  ORF type:complete len:175 (+),score=42.39 gnl/TRDRNA2_/TRDRNA2_137597_c2_seq1:50-526(+)